MRRATLLLLVLSAALIAGCGAKKQEGRAAYHWPATPEQLQKLRKMPRAEREAWFANADLPRYDARKRDGAIKIDGLLDEAAWKKAQVITLSNGEAGGGEVRYATRVRMLWDDSAIYLAFECDDPDVHQPLTKHDDPLWQHDLVEVFIDPDGDGASYMELHVAPSGAMSDSIYADFGPDADWFAIPNWKRFAGSTTYTAFDAKGMTSAVKIDGTLNQPDDTDKGYVVEWRIPYSDLVNVVRDVAKSKHPIDVSLFEQRPIEKPGATTMLDLGTLWRMNFNRCDDSIKLTTKDAKGKLVNVPEYSAWVPTTGSFHMPFLFGRVIFVH